jgi:hypothetical protein
MAITVISTDQWVAISPDYEIFVRTDALTGPGYQVRIETSRVGGLQVRCLSPLPNGFWLRPIKDSPLWADDPDDPYDTGQFRTDTGNRTGQP